MSEAKKEDGMLALGVIVAIFVITISSMAIRQVNTDDVSDSYETSVQRIASIRIGVAAVTLIAAPILAVPDAKTKAMFLTAVILCALVISISGMAIHLTQSNTSEGYDNMVRIMGAIGITAAGGGIIGVFCMRYLMNK